MSNGALVAGFTPVSDHNQIPVGVARPLAASEQIGKGQFCTVSTSTGYGYLNAGNYSNHVPAGIGDVSELSDTSATAGLAFARCSDRWAYGLSNSTVSNDSFTDADFSVPFYIAGSSTIGKLAYTGADATLAKRTIGGMVYGLSTIDSTPVFWTGPIAYEVARSAIVNNSRVVANDWFALTANTTRAEATIPRASKINGKVVQVRIMADGGFTSHDTNYWTITVAKRTATTPGTAVTIATATLKTTSGGGIGTLTAFKYADLTLSATAANLDILADDVLTVTCTAETTAAAMAHFTVEVIAKVS